MNARRLSAVWWTVFLLCYRNYSKLNYVAMQVVTYCIVFWENPKGSNTVGIINQATKGGWLPELFGQKYGWNVVIVLILTVGMFIYLKYCKQGYEIAVVGESENCLLYTSDAADE